MNPMKYHKALERLQEILQKIENEEIDVDELSVRVKEAVELIKMCKTKIEKSELEIKQVVEDLKAEQLGE